MRLLTTFALLLVACGGTRPNLNDVDGGVVLEDAGSPDAGVGGWGGTYLLGDESTFMPCDGGGAVEYGGFMNGPEGILSFVDTDGGIKAGFLFVPMEGSGAVHTGPMVSSNRSNAPDHFGTDVYTTMTGQFQHGPNRFDGHLDVTAWNGQCSATVEAHWTLAPDAGP